MAITTPNRHLADAPGPQEVELESRIARQREQERLLRDLLFDARNDLVRERLGVNSGRSGASRDALGAQRPLAAVTIISRNYLAQARTVAQTFLSHEPESRFYLLVVDGLPEGADLGVEATVIDLEELAIPSLYEMCFKYGVVEFSTAVKPYLLSLLLRQYGEQEILYFDPDLMIMSRLVALRHALAEGDIVLTPHITRPLPVDGKRPSEQDIMISGAYNLGFLALRRSPQSEEFLTWWEQRLQDGCRIDVPKGLFTDQKWIDLVPSLFPSTVILRDLTYNVAFWNLHERTITRRGETFLVNDQPASFFHLSGFHPDEPRKLSKHQDRIEVAPASGLADLLDRYADKLRQNGFADTASYEYGFERFDNGIRVHPILRQIYLNLSSEERARFGNPFATDGEHSFLDWATRPSDETGGLSPFLRGIHTARYDLALTYPDVDGRDRTAFVNWARRWGSAEMRFEPELVRDGETPATVPGTVKAKSRPASRERPPTRRPARSSYLSLIEHIREVARGALPAGSVVLVISKGDSRLLDLGGSEGWHFPQTTEGLYSGYYPAESSVAIAHLEDLRRRGAGYLLIPQTGLWWLEYYEGLRRHLEKRYRAVAHGDDSCVIYSLRGEQNGHRPREIGARHWWQWWQRRAAAPSPDAAPEAPGGGQAR